MILKPFFILKIFIYRKDTVLFIIILNNLIQFYSVHLPNEDTNYYRRKQRDW